MSLPFWFMSGAIADEGKSLELCDESGTVVARVVPVLDQSLYERVEPYISPEELQRRREEPDISTAEVLDYLKKL